MSTELTTEVNLKEDIIETLAEISRVKSHDLWVINNMARIDDGKRIGHVVFTITTPEGPSIIFVPETWAPVNLANQAERSEIIKSTMFRRALTRRQILIVKDEAAERILRDRDAKTEHDIAQYVITNDGRRPRAEEIFETRRGENPEEEQENADFNNVNPKVYEAITRDDISEDEQYKAIFSMNKMGLIKDSEKEFIVRSSKFNKVKAYVTNKIG